jgi:hypothetical protein
MRAPVCTYGLGRDCACPECLRIVAKEEERDAIVRRIELHADGLEIEARKLPLGLARRGGGLHGAPEYDVRMLVVSAFRQAAKLARGGA